MKIQTKILRFLEDHIACRRRDWFDPNSFCNLVFIGAIFLIAGISLYRHLFKEGFGTSPGTMVQLQTSHVPTEEDAYYYKYVYPKLVRKEIYNMTESDL
jgi:hypothetical protein